MRYDKMVDSLKVCGADTRFTASGYRFLCFTAPIAKMIRFPRRPPVCWITLRRAGVPDRKLAKIELLPDAASTSSLLAESNTTGIA